MPDSYGLRSVDAQRVATLARTAPGPATEHVAPVVGPIFPSVLCALAEAGAHRAGPAVALYRPDPSGRMQITAGFVALDDLPAVQGVDLLDLPAAVTAAVAVHQGAPSGLGAAWAALMAALAADGPTPSDAGREVYLTPGDRPQGEWISELVQPITRPAVG